MHRNTGPLRRSIAYATLVFSVSFGPVLWSSVTFGKFLSPDPRQQGQQLLRSRLAITPSRIVLSTGHSGPTPGRSGPFSGHSGLSSGHTEPSPGHHRTTQWPFASWPLKAFTRPLRGHFLVTGYNHGLVSDNHGPVITSRILPLRHHWPIHLLLHQLL